MAKIYKKHFSNNGTIVHVPEGVYYQIEKDREGGVTFRYSSEKFKVYSGKKLEKSERSHGEAYQPINHDSWAKLLRKPESANNIESLVIEKS